MQQQREIERRIIPCEAELQELMHQIDIMVSHKRCEWEQQRQTLEARLEVREQELLNTRYSFDSKNQEVGRLRHLLEEMDKSNKATVQKYEEQLNGLQSELGKLKSSYKKLQRHHIRQARETSKETEEEDSLFETSKLNRKLEQTCLNYQSQLSNRVALQEEAEQKRQCEVRQLRSELETAQKTLLSNEVTIEQLRSDVQELTSRSREHSEETQRLLQDLRQSHTQRQKMEEELSELRQELHTRDDLLKAADLEEKQLRREGAKLREQLTKQVSAIRSTYPPFKQQTCLNYQSQLSNRVALQEEAEQKRQCEVRQLRSELETAQKTLLSNEVTIEQLRSDVQELTSRSREHSEETQRLLQDLRQSHTQRQKMEEELSELRQELHTRDDLLKAADLEEKQLRREGEKLREQLTKQVSAIRMEEQSSKNIMATEMLNLKVDLESTCQQLQASQNKEQILRAEMTRLQSGLEASHSHCMQLKDCLRRTEKEVHRLKAVEEDKNNDIIKVAKIQLEALNLENKHLKELIATMEAKTDMQTLGNSLNELWGNIPATSYAEKKNKTLQKDQALLQAELDTPSRATQGKHSVEQGAMERREQQDRFQKPCTLRLLPAHCLPSLGCSLPPVYHWSVRLRGSRAASLIRSE
ncbi:UNVERIFIED_CONTAM: hypothetical protein FKN15_015193 [Acipenser sinensis]